MNMETLRPSKTDMTSPEVKKKLTKTADKILSRPFKRSMVLAEVQDPMILTKCIGFCNPPRIFRAVSNINKICPQCKSSERWREY